MLPLLPDLKDLLETNKLVTNNFLNQFPTTQNEPLFEALINHHIMSEKILHDLFKKALGIKNTSLKLLKIDPNINKQKTYTQGYITLYETDKEIAIATNNPYIKIIPPTEKKIILTLVPQHEIHEFHKKSDLNTSIKTLISTAYESKASDIHCYEQDNHSAVIYFRINGQLQSFSHISKVHYTQLKQLFKLEAHLDLSLYLKPQDGHIRWVLKNTKIDTRISFIPTIHGEDIACRLFNQTNTYETLTDLKIPNVNQKLIKAMCHHKHGLILVTGPTGSGKTTTLYSLLRYLQTQLKQNIITLEDPIEKELYGIRQTSINPEKGFSFASGLKAVLRQDPDIIMIGEIRDAETAHIVLEAAYTGHLVLSSLHTHDIASTLLRLRHFKCDDFLTTYALRGIIAQKLINPHHTYDTPRYLDQEVLSCHSPLLTPFNNLTDLNKLGDYIPYQNKMT